MSVSRHPLCTTDTARAAASIPTDDAAAVALQTSLARIAASGADFTKRFYERLFSRHPEVRPLFPPDLAEQQVKLRDMLQKVIENLSAPNDVRAGLASLGRSHQELGVRPEHYPLVAVALVEALVEADPGRSSFLEGEWRQAIELVGDVMVEGARGRPSGETSIPHG